MKNTIHKFTNLCKTGKFELSCRKKPEPHKQEKFCERCEYAEIPKRNAKTVYCREHDKRWPRKWTCDLCRVRLLPNEQLPF
jgi:hypothetical protein